MPTMHVKRSISIDAPAAKVYSVLSNFDRWGPWSPWLIMEPEASVKVSEDKKFYEWKGDRVGSGNMKILSERENEEITYDLNFIAPWKSQADVRFELSSHDGQTQVDWFMDSSLPWFIFFMKKTMEAMIGADYERGLDMLKAYVEKGTTPSKLNFVGAGAYEGCQFIGVKTSCSMDEIDKQMENDFGKLYSLIEQKKNIEAMEPLSIYHKWDMVNKRAEYTAAIPVNSEVGDIPAGFITGNIPALNTYRLEHTGPYKHLGNAWGTLYTMQRTKEFKVNKKVDPFEIYLNDPDQTPANELLTRLYFPIKT